MGKYQSRVSGLYLTLSQPPTHKDPSPPIFTQLSSGINHFTQLHHNDDSDLTKQLLNYSHPKPQHIPTQQAAETSESERCTANSRRQSGKLNLRRAEKEQNQNHKTHSLISNHKLLSPSSSAQHRMNQGKHPTSTGKNGFFCGLQKEVYPQYSMCPSIFLPKPLVCDQLACECRRHTTPRDSVLQVPSSLAPRPMRVFPRR